MKSILLSMVMAMLCLFVPSANAQTNFLVGISGGQQLNNTTGSVTAGIEVPFLHHFELNLLDTYSPYEMHVGLGTGHANLAKAGVIVWVRPTFGITGNLEDSGYSVTQISKTSENVMGGFVKKAYVFGIPSRLSLGYVQEVNQGIFYGAETSQLRGLYFRVDSRLFGSNNVSLRLIEQFSTGRVLEQGNPVCDGTYGNGSQNIPPMSACPRTPSIGGGVNVSLVLDFHRHQDKNSLF